MEIIFLKNFDQALDSSQVVMPGSFGKADSDLLNIDLSDKRGAGITFITTNITSMPPDI